MKKRLLPFLLAGLALGRTTFNAGGMAPAQGAGAHYHI